MFLGVCSACSGRADFVSATQEYPMNVSRWALRALYVLTLSCTLALPAESRAEGFAIMESSARGMALGGGLVARGGDPSSIAYNPAAITLLPGTQTQANLAISQFYWGVDTRQGGIQQNSHSSHQTWPIPSLYLTHQLNDKLWLGMGMYTRFGLGVKYPHDWPGGSSLQSVKLITSSLMPTLAYKINDVFSVAAGIEVMGATMQMRRTNLSIPGMNIGDVNINGHGASFGGNLSLHAKINDQWSMGLLYRTPMSLKVEGKTRYDRPIGQMAPTHPQLKFLQNSNLRGTMHLPDSIAFGVSYAPLDNLSFEADATYTLWSRFCDFNMYMKHPVNDWQNSTKDWENSWTFSFSAEYKPVEWMALRAGFMYETSPMNYGYADYMIPSNGRNYYTAGIGFFYGNWTLDLAYMYIHNHVLDYTESARSGTGVLEGRTTHPHAHNFGIGIGYRF